MGLSGCHRGCHPHRVRRVTIEAGGLAADQARVQILRRRLGARLATHRVAAGVSQSKLGQALGRTRSTVSKIEHGTRGLPTTLWKIADEVCRAQGVLITEHSELAQAEQDYRAWCRLRDRQVQQQAALAQAESFTASPTLPASPGSLSGAVPQPDRLRGDGWPGMALVHGELAGELMAMITRLVRAMGRRDAVRLVGWVLAVVGASGLDPDECRRVVRAVEAPGRLDGQVINNLATTLAHCKRQEDQLGPYEVLDTVVAQHGLVHRLLEGGCPQQLRKPLRLVDSNMASAEPVTISV